jgi:penicillin amidase
MQINTPTQNVYGVSIPGTPTIIIGFNDSLAWGVTSAQRDVEDFYEIRFKDSSMQEYRWKNEWKKTEFRKEIIKIKGKPDEVETIAMTVFGPVIYDPHYPNKINGNQSYAVRWTAHDPSNEWLSFYKLNAAKNYKDYENAISTYSCPALNFAFASVGGNIAIRQQGKFPAKWKYQGDFVMPGFNSNYNWQGFIPAEENPQILNPASGFVSSANQMPVVPDNYPYYVGRASDFSVYRAYLINKKLSSMNKITIAEMMKMQTDNYNVVAEMARPVLLKWLDSSKLSGEENEYVDILRKWNLRNDAGEKGATIFTLLWDNIYHSIYSDEMNQSPLPMMMPEASTLLDGLLANADYSFADDVSTVYRKERMKEVVATALHSIIPELRKAANENKLEWEKYKDTYLSSLTQLPALGRYHLPIGGGADIINATQTHHGPSWRMVVHLTSPIDAYVVYPGGESGNPGSKYYDSFVDDWVAGKYYSVLFLSEKDAATNNKIKWNMQFSKL